eukprot:107927-Prorocentrum_minimum.AAC.2
MDTPLPDDDILRTPPRPSRGNQSTSATSPRAREGRACHVGSRYAPPVSICSHARERAHVTGSARTQCWACADRRDSRLQLPSSPFSPFISFASTLSPITPSKTVHLQTYNELCPKMSPAPPSFNTPYSDRR